MMEPLAIIQGGGDLVRIGTTLASKSKMAIVAREEEEDDDNFDRGCTHKKLS